MIDKRKKRRGAADASNPDEAWKPTAVELEVVKYLHRNVPTKEGRLAGTVVRTFLPNEAVDALLESPWAKVQPSEVSSKTSKPRLFTTQTAAIAYMRTLLGKQLFHRAIRVKKRVTTKKREGEPATKSKVKKSASNSKMSKDADGGDQEANENSPEQSEKAEVKASEEVTTTTSSSTESSKTKSSSSSTKPMRLEMTQEQEFILDDPLTVYVWIYEPPPTVWTLLAGSALLIGIILCCLFPVWPTELRTGAYYLSLLASFLFGLLIALALVRLILYLMVWVSTLGTRSFWLFPNYFQDCGFFESFRPVYSFEPILIGNGSSKKEKVSGKREKTAKSSKTPALKATNPDGPTEEPSEVTVAPNPEGRVEKDILGKLD